MARDLIFGRTRRDWSIGLDLLPKPDLSSEAELAEKIRAEKPALPHKSAEDVVKDKLREEAPLAMRAYDKYHPSYRDRQVSVRVKTDLLGRR